MQLYVPQFEGCERLSFQSSDKLPLHQHTRNRLVLLLTMNDRGLSRNSEFHCRRISSFTDFLRLRLLFMCFVCLCVCTYVFGSNIYKPFTHSLSCPSLSSFVLVFLSHECECGEYSNIPRHDSPLLPSIEKGEEEKVTSKIHCLSLSLQHVLTFFSSCSGITIELQYSGGEIK